MTTQVLTIGLADRFETGQSIGYHRYHWQYAILPNQQRTWFETIDHRHPHLIGCNSVFQGHCCHKTASCLPRLTPLPPGARHPVDIIRLNDAADGLLSSDLGSWLAAALVANIQAVSYLTPNWRPSLTKPVLVCDNRCIARKPLIGGGLVFAKIVFQSMTSGDGSDCIATRGRLLRRQRVLLAFRADKAEIDLGVMIVSSHNRQTRLGLAALLLTTCLGTSGWAQAADEAQSKGKIEARSELFAKDPPISSPAGKAPARAASAPTPWRKIRRWWCSGPATPSPRITTSRAATSMR